MSDTVKLTNVIIGLFKHNLINAMSDEQWTFLTGLIMYANDKGFKNPIDLSVKQAIGAGGGNSRQSVNRRRNALKKIKIDGKPILKVKAGVPGQNIVAKYDIDYDLICSYNGIWYDEKKDASQKSDGKRTQGGRKADGGRDHPKIREEKDQGPPNPQTDETTSIEQETQEAGADSDSPKDLRMHQKAIHIRKLIVQKWGKQIREEPTIGACKDLLRQFLWDHKIIVCAITEGPEILDYPDSVMKLVGRIAERIERESGGITTEPLTEEQEIVKALRYCAQFPNRADQIYPLLEELAKETGRPLLELYAVNDYLLKSLEVYKAAAE